MAAIMEKLKIQLEKSSIEIDLKTKQLWDDPTIIKRQIWDHVGWTSEFKKRKMSLENGIQEVRPTW